MDKETFVNELRKIGIYITDEQLEQLDKYYLLLKEWNEKINLTRIIEEKDVYLKHFYDSLTLFKVYNLNQNLSICDIGTGAGFPGLVLKIVFPSLSVTLVDALQKRINFLNIVIQKLDLKNIQTIHIRAEDYAKNSANRFDIVTCRAVSRLSNLVEYCVPLLKKEGSFIPMKANCDEEMEEISNNRRIKIIKVDKFLLPIENSNRTIIVIKKQ